MAAEQGPTGVGRHRKVEHVPQHRVKVGKHRRSVERPETPRSSHSPSHPLNIPREASANPIGVVSTGVTSLPTQDDGITRVRESLQKLKKREDFDSMLRAREEVGCVIRSAESAFNAKATIQEIEERLADIRDIQELGRNGVNTYNDLRDEDIRRVIAYYERLKTHDTPLGKAMRDYTVSAREMAVDDIRNAIVEGKKVLASTIVHYEGRDIPHLMHIDYMGSTGRFVDVSDNPPYEIQPSANFCFVFDRIPDVDDRQIA